ncbi:Putative flagella-related protein H [uncultured archaeon]|nr:Putative flagella-related protein H [uncultured archaeon]
MVLRISTGIKGFDKLIEGGLPKGSLTLVSGNPGTCKSIFCLQTAYNVASSGVPALFVSFEQDEENLSEQLNQLGAKIGKVKGLKIIRLEPEDPQVMTKILNAAKDVKAGLVVVDSIASLTSGPSKPDGQNYTTAQILDSVIPVPLDAESLNRMKVKLILDTIRQTGATALLTSEIIRGQEGYSRDTLSEFLCDTIVVLHSVEGEDAYRTLNIPKMRLTKQKMGIYSFEVGKKGFIVKSSE